MDMEKVRTCEVNGCYEVVRIRVKPLCPKHYSRFVRHGDPLFVTRLEPGTLIRDKLIHFGWEENPGEKCVKWTGRLDYFNYGVFKDYGRTLRATREIMGLLNGEPVQEGMVVMHTCDNPPCVNQKHLRVGTQLDNIMDMVSKGRHRSQTKLTVDEVLGVVNMVREQGLTQSEVCKRTGIDSSQVSRIVNGKIWSKITKIPRSPR